MKSEMTFSTVIDSDYSGNKPIMTDEYESRVFMHEYKHSNYSTQMSWLDGAFYSWYGGRKFRRNEPETFKKVIEGIIGYTVLYGVAVAFSFLPLFIMKFILMGGTLLGTLLFVLYDVRKTRVSALYTLIMGAVGYYYQSNYPNAHVFTGFHELDKIVYTIMMAVAVLAMIRRLHNRYVWKYLDHIGRKYNIVVDDWFGV